MFQSELKPNLHDWVLLIKIIAYICNVMMKVILELRGKNPVCYASDFYFIWILENILYF